MVSLFLVNSEPKILTLRQYKLCKQVRVVPVFSSTTIQGS